MVQLCVVVWTACLVCVTATKVQQCANESTQDLTEAVTLTPCKSLPCRLKKGTDQRISITFTPKKDTREIKNKVWAELFGIPVAFIGVDGGSACDKLFTETGKKAFCPVKAGTSLVYKDSIPILNFYPTLYITVQWSLQDDGKEDIICFRVPARIL